MPNFITTNGNNERRQPQRKLFDASLITRVVSYVSIGIVSYIDSKTKKQLTAESLNIRPTIKEFLVATKKYFSSIQFHYHISPRKLIHTTHL